MRVIINTVLLAGKRCMSHLSFWIGFLALPIFLMLLSSMSSDTISNWRIGLYTEESGLSEKTIEELCSQESFFEFYQCDSLEELQKDIMAKRAECGFFFQEGFEAAFYENNLDKQVLVYYAPSTIADQAARESVFSAALKQANQTLIHQFMVQETGVEPDEQAYSALYDKYANNGSIFHLAYEELKGDGSGVEQNSFLLSPERGMFAIYLWAIGLFSVLAIYEDQKNGIYPLLKKGQVIVLKWCTVWIPVLLASLTGLIGLGMSGILHNVLLEVCYVLCYGIAITFFSLMLQNIWKNPGYYSCFVTLLLSASVVFCPVFISINQFFPDQVWIQKLLIPDYYLEIFIQNNKRVLFFGIMINVVLYKVTSLFRRV